MKMCNELTTLVNRPGRRTYPLFFGQLDPIAELAEAVARTDGATVFAYYVSEPSQYGVVKFDDSGHAIDIVEKPTQFLTNWAVGSVSN